jgi:four helix bundle protein
MPIRSFTELVAWKRSHSLVIDVYKITKSFPNEERFGLTDQLRRAVVSVSSNIAEGFNKRTSSDKNHFYSIALGSVAEIQNQLLISRDLGYITNEVFQTLGKQTVEVHKLINGLIKSSQTKK